MYKTILNSTPWLILAGSGGIADILVTLINQACWDTEIVQELLIETFPNGQSAAMASWIKLVRATFMYLPIYKISVTFHQSTFQHCGFSSNRF